MTSLEKRVDSLEEIMKQLAISQAQLNHSLDRLSKENKEFKDNMDRVITSLSMEMSEFKDEMSEFKDEMSEFKNEMSEFKDKITKYIEKLDQRTNEMDKKWGDLANSLGIVVEAIIAPGFPDLLTQEFGCESFYKIMVNVEVRKPENRDQIKEFDLIAICNNLIFVNETKPKIKKEYVEEFKKFIESGEFFEYFPEYKGKHLVPVISSLRMKPHELQLLTKNNIFGVVLKHSSLKVPNYKKVKKHYPFLTTKE